MAAPSLHTELIAHLSSPEHGPLPQRHPEPLHVLDVANVGGHWWARCSCGEWTSESQDTCQAARSLTCGVEVARLEGARLEALAVCEGLRNLSRFRRAALQDAALDRDVPSVPVQV